VCDKAGGSFGYVCGEAGGRCGYVCVGRWAGGVSTTSFQNLCEIFLGIRVTYSPKIGLTSEFYDEFY